MDSPQEVRGRRTGALARVIIVPALLSFAVCGGALFCVEASGRCLHPFVGYRLWLPIGIVVALVMMAYVAWLDALVRAEFCALGRFPHAALLLLTVTVSVGAGLAPYSIRLSCCGDAPFGTYASSFDANEWRAGDSDGRWPMMGDLLGKIVPGRSSRELQRILGPCEVDSENLRQLRYRVADIGLTEIDLALSFGPSGMFRSWSLGP